MKPQRNGRKFGFTMAVPASLFALLALYRHHPRAATALFIIALAFLLFALVAPKLLEPVEAAWRAFARVLGAINTRIIMGLLYLIFIVPLGLIFRVFGRDEMKRRRVAGSISNWEDYRARQRDERHYENMF
jgi:predicted permease